MISIFEYGLFSPTFGDDVVGPLIKMREQEGSTVCNLCGSPIKVEEFVKEVERVVQKSPKKVVPGKITLTGKNTCAKERLGYKETVLQEAISHSFSSLK